MSRSLDLTTWVMHRVVLVYVLALSAFAPAGEFAAPFLLLMRVFQGMGAGLMIPVATTVITNVYEEHERGRALAVSSCVPGSRW